jgi:hypothetical protein
MSLSFLMATLLEVAQVLGTVFAALAAMAACVAVFLTLRESRLSHQPHLRIQPIVSPVTGCYGAVITNAGDGVASGVHFVVADFTTLISGPVLHGFLRPGETVEILSPQPWQEAGDRRGVVGYVIGRDRFGFVHDWTTAEDHAVNYERSWRTKFRKRPNYGEIIPRLAQWFPNHPDPNGLQRVEVVSQRREPPP